MGVKPGTTLGTQQGYSSDQPVQIQDGILQIRPPNTGCPVYSMLCSGGCHPYAPAPATGHPGRRDQVRGCSRSSLILQSSPFSTRVCPSRPQIQQSPDKQQVPATRSVPGPRHQPEPGPPEHIGCWWSRSCWSCGCWRMSVWWELRPLLQTQSGSCCRCQRSNCPSARSDYSGWEWSGSGNHLHWRSPAGWTVRQWYWRICSWRSQFQQTKQRLWCPANGPGTGCSQPQPIQSLQSESGPASTVRKINGNHHHHTLRSQSYIYEIYFSEYLC